ncbi:unnamed protein product [Calypogeia fissa]
MTGSKGKRWGGGGGTAFGEGVEGFVMNGRSSGNVKLCGNKANERERRDGTTPRAQQEKKVDERAAEAKEVSIAGSAAHSSDGKRTREGGRKAGQGEQGGSKGRKETRMEEFQFQSRR